MVIHDKHLVEILACPIDKTYPLTLIDFQQYGEDVEEGVYCVPCASGSILLQKAFKIMLSDEKMRDKTLDLKFLKNGNTRCLKSAEVLILGISKVHFRTIEIVNFRYLFLEALDLISRTTLPAAFNGFRYK